MNSRKLRWVEFAFRAAALTLSSLTAVLSHVPLLAQQSSPTTILAKS
jgi:hypothetical protein